MSAHPLPRLRRLCLALPEAHEVEAWGAPTFRVRNKLFAMFAAASDHHGGGRDGVWVKAAPGNQQLMVATFPQRYFVPPYVGPSGWVGVWLDEVCDWAELAELLRDAWVRTAPKRLAATLASAGAESAAGAAKPAAARTPAARTPGARKGAGAKKTAARAVKKASAKKLPARKASAKKAAARAATTRAARKRR